MAGKGILIVSPHLDDAALSLGGMMIRNPNTCVLDLFNTAWSENKGLNKLGVEIITSSNLKEEEKVMHLLMATFNYCALPEALVRDPNMEWCAPIDQKRDYKVQLMAAFAIACAGINSKEIFFPLAVGEHIDHVLVYNLVAPFITHVKKSGTVIKLYEDLPYSTYNDNENNYQRRMSRVSQELDITPELIDITTELDSKISILSNYKSQLNKDHLQRVRAYALGLGEETGYSGKAFERVWVVNNVLK